MKLFARPLLALAAIAISLTPALAGDHVFETTPELVNAMVARFPDQARAVTDKVVAMPEALIPELAHVAHEITGRCGGYMDITGEAPRKVSTQAREPLPELSVRKRWIAEMLDMVRPDNIKGFVNLYSGQFKTRFARSPQGIDAPRWLATQWQNMANRFDRGDIKVELLPPPRGYEQASVRVTIPGKNPEAPIVALGGHLDSISRGDHAPGADDDASGIAALTEAYRIILMTNAHPNRTIQIFGYAAEELGLLGSRAIAEAYQQRGIRVRGVMQLDMIAFPGEQRKVTFMMDNVDRALSLWTKELYGMYVGTNVAEDRCGYACSDHASWTRYGYPSVMPFESSMNEMNRRIHTNRDLWDELLDADYAAQFVKLALAFTAELSQ